MYICNNCFFFIMSHCMLWPHRLPRIRDYTAEKRWLFQPCVGLSQLQVLKHKVIMWFPHYNSTVISCILCHTLSRMCVYRVHVSRAMGDMTCAWNMIGICIYTSPAQPAIVMVNQCYVMLNELVNSLFLHCSMTSLLRWYPMTHRECRSDMSDDANNSHGMQRRGLRATT